MGNIWSPVERECQCPDERALMNLKRKRGGSPEKYTAPELEEAADLIHYLSADGSYEPEHMDEWVATPGLTVIHITSLGSKIAVGLNKAFTKIPTATKLNALKNPSQAQLMFSDLERDYAELIKQELIEDKLPMENPFEKRWDSKNRLRMIPSFNKVRNMGLSFLTVSGQYWWPAGLLSEHEVGQYDSRTIEEDFGDINLKDMTINDPNAERVIRGLMPNEEYAEFFLSRLRTIVDDQPHMRLKLLLDVDLRTLSDNNLLPGEGVLFILACRDCKDVRKWRNVDEVRSEAALDDTVQSDANLGVDASLDEYCSQINCVSRVRYAELRSNDPNNYCKISGCSRCMSRPDDPLDMGNKCLSCRETKAILIYPNKDSARCLMCFTVEEIFDLATDQLGALGRYTPDITVESLMNPIYNACRIDIRILKIILGWQTDNAEQKVFTRISDVEEAIEVLNVLASFQYVIDPSSPILQVDQPFLEYMRSLLTDLLVGDKIRPLRDAPRKVMFMLREVRLLLEWVVRELEQIVAPEYYSIYTELMKRIITTKESLERRADTQ